MCAWPCPRVAAGWNSGCCFLSIEVESMRSLRKFVPLTITAFLLAALPRTGGQQVIEPQFSRGCYICDVVERAYDPCTCGDHGFIGCAGPAGSILRMGCRSTSQGTAASCSDINGPIGWTADCVEAGINWPVLIGCHAATGACVIATCAACLDGVVPSCGACVACLTGAFALGPCGDPCAYFTGCVVDANTIMTVNGWGYACDVEGLCPPAVVPTPG